MNRKEYEKSKFQKLYKFYSRKFWEWSTKETIIKGENR